MKKATISIEFNAALINEKDIDTVARFLEDFYQLLPERERLDTTTVKKLLDRVACAFVAGLNQGRAEALHWGGKPLPKRGDAKDGH